MTATTWGEPHVISVLPSDLRLLIQGACRMEGVHGSASLADSPRYRDCLRQEIGRVGEILPPPALSDLRVDRRRAVEELCGLASFGSRPGPAARDRYYACLWRRVGPPRVEDHAPHRD